MYKSQNYICHGLNIPLYSHRLVVLNQRLNYQLAITIKVGYRAGTLEMTFPTSLFMPIKPY